ncbi:MAG: hypothetical protein GEU83_19645 [Pseudonocardiaceae bacterium]|nr:hypothetical protein [Pseudonocardiaceae bacterium]
MLQLTTTVMRWAITATGMVEDRLTEVRRRGEAGEGAVSWLIAVGAAATIALGVAALLKSKILAKAKGWDF